MGKINIGRLVLGGIFAGIVNDILGYGVDGWLLQQSWASGMKAVGRGPFSSNALIWFNLLGFVTGFVAVWIYVAIRPRLGPGLKTAIYAGIAVWILTALLPNASFTFAAGLFSHHLMFYATIGALVEIAVATIIGAAVYKEA